jgi:chorismate synthase
MAAAERPGGRLKLVVRRLPATLGEAAFWAELGGKLGSLFGSSAAIMAAALGNLRARRPHEVLT